ncbi:alpha/beta hydrolase [Actinokineospora iranica]|uniref:S-formylglutathione hydrolase FrmB n=1 Tax=Actinokineospora iranica TaxID=1271860 RepID=A0A1G6KS04_9PSEU|nr:alpha/beta hydrolase-fold protein [Actinokineospora iranica]SDC33859.1 S-formylglutathione hydrolase FrmB [Actinokineospora iranica]
MKRLHRIRWALLGGLVVALTAVVPAAHADTAPPPLADGFGLQVVRQPVWADSQRTFAFSVRTAEVPEFTVLPGQVSGEHVILVTLPEGYDGVTRYPVHYTLHGGGDIPNSLRQKEIVERATAGVPVITVTPNGGGRSWYSNWVNPGGLGKQNWENFHLDQVIPFIDANLRTIPAKEGRAISGHSMGGFGAFHYAEHRPDLFGYVGSFSGGLDLLNQKLRAAVVGTTQLASYGTPTVDPAAIFGPPVWPLDGVWNAQSPAQHVAPLRGMGVAIYTGDGTNPAADRVLAEVEVGAVETAIVTSRFLTSAGIAHEFVNYRGGEQWAPGCLGEHNNQACLQADMDHFVSLIMARLQHP